MTGLGRRRDRVGRGPVEGVVVEVDDRRRRWQGRGKRWLLRLRWRRWRRGRGCARRPERSAVGGERAPSRALVPEPGPTASVPGGGPERRAVRVGLEHRHGGVHRGSQHVGARGSLDVADDVAHRWSRRGRPRGAPARPHPRGASAVGRRRRRSFWTTCARRVRRRPQKVVGERALVEDDPLDVHRRRAGDRREGAPGVRDGVARREPASPGKIGPDNGLEARV